MALMLFPQRQGLGLSISEDTEAPLSGAQGVEGWVWNVTAARDVSKYRPRGRWSSSRPRSPGNSFGIMGLPYLKKVEFWLLMFHWKVWTHLFSWPVISALVYLEAVSVVGERGASMVRLLKVQILVPASELGGLGQVLTSCVLFSLWIRCHRHSSLGWISYL